MAESATKLLYFNVDARAQAARMMLTIAGVEFEDDRISMGGEDFSMKWGKLKSEQPLAQVPVLTVNGEKFPQTCAINNYIARKYGFIGSGERDAFVCDVLSESGNELMTETALTVMIFTRYKFREYPGDEVITENQKIITDKFSRLAQLVRTYQGERNSNKYILGDKVTAADIYFFSILDYVKKALPDLVLEDWITNWELRFLADDGVGRYLSSRPKADFEPE